jgi:hypothetical protein
VPDAEIPDLDGLRWQTDNATITEVLQIIGKKVQYR